MRKLTFAELAFEVVTKFVSPEDIPRTELRDIINRSFSVFRSPGEINPALILFLQPYDII
jgi:threonine synthase